MDPGERWWQIQPATVPPSEPIILKLLFAANGVTWAGTLPPSTDPDQLPAGLDLTIGADQTLAQIYGDPAAPIQLTGVALGTFCWTLEALRRGLYRLDTGELLSPPPSAAAAFHLTAWGTSDPIATKYGLNPHQVQQLWARRLAVACWLKSALQGTTVEMLKASPQLQLTTAELDALVATAANPNDTMLPWHRPTLGGKRLGMLRFAGGVRASTILYALETRPNSSMVLPIGTTKTFAEQWHLPPSNIPSSVPALASLATPGRCQSLFRIGDGPMCHLGYFWDDNPFVAMGLLLKLIARAAIRGWLSDQATSSDPLGGFDALLRASATLGWTLVDDLVVDPQGIFRGPEIPGVGPIGVPNLRQILISGTLNTFQYMQLMQSIGVLGCMPLILGASMSAEVESTAPLDASGQRFPEVSTFPSYAMGSSSPPLPMFREPEWKSASAASPPSVVVGHSRVVLPPGNGGYGIGVRPWLVSPPFGDPGPKPNNPLTPPALLGGALGDGASVRELRAFGSASPGAQIGGGSSVFALEAVVIHQTAMWSWPAIQGINPAQAPTEVEKLARSRLVADSIVRMTAAATGWRRALDELSAFPPGGAKPQSISYSNGQFASADATLLQLAPFAVWAFTWSAVHFARMIAYRKVGLATMTFPPGAGTWDGAGITSLMFAPNVWFNQALRVTGASPPGSGYVPIGILAAPYHGSCLRSAALGVMPPGSAYFLDAPNSPGMQVPLLDQLVAAAAPPDFPRLHRSDVWQHLKRVIWSVQVENSMPTSFVPYAPKVTVSLATVNPTSDITLFETSMFEVQSRLDAFALRCAGFWMLEFAGPLGQLWAYVAKGTAAKVPVWDGKAGAMVPLSTQWPFSAMYGAMPCEIGKAVHLAAGSFWRLPPSPEPGAGLRCLRHRTRMP